MNMHKGVINAGETRFLYSNQPLARYMHETLFTDSNGTEIKKDDVVEFYQKGDIFPTSGHVDCLNYLRVATFNTLLNKWEYFKVKSNRVIRGKQHLNKEN